MGTSKGMVVVSGLTYRIVETQAGYEVVRLVDDRLFGSLGVGPAFAATDSASAETLAAIARVALREGKLRWLEAAAPPSAQVSVALRRAWRDLENVLGTAIDRAVALVRSLWPVAPRVSARAHVVGRSSSMVAMNSVTFRGLVR